MILYGLYAITAERLNLQLLGEIKDHKTVLGHQQRSNLHSAVSGILTTHSPRTQML